jgi:hypothetical protein
MSQVAQGKRKERVFQSANRKNFLRTYGGGFFRPAREFSCCHNPISQLPKRYPLHMVLKHKVAKRHGIIFLSKQQNSPSEFAASQEIAE